MGLRIAWLLSGLGLLVIGALPPVAAEEYPVRLERSYQVPMRDGVVLSTDLYFPKDAEGKLPVVLMRTPYNKNVRQRAEGSDARFFASHGYVVAVQDKRGKFESEGEYIVGGGDEKDSYDTLTWLAEQPWSEGKIGMYGCSYLGELQIRQASLQHPNLAAMVPQAAGGGVGSVEGKYRYFGARIGGALEFAAGVGWFPAAGSKVRYQLPSGLSREEFLLITDRFKTGPPKPPTFEPTAELWSSLPIAGIMERTKALPNDFVDLMSRKVTDPWWDQFGYLKDGDMISAPALHVNSWYDFGAADTLFTAKYFSEHATNKAARDHQYIIMSPTTHCRSDRMTAPTMVGDRDMGDARLDTRAIYLRWFDRWLRGNTLALEGLPKVQYYLMGMNEWRDSEVWPPADTKEVSYYLHSDGRANSRFGTGVLFTAEPGEEPPDSYVYDPATAVPTLGGPTCCTGGGAMEGAFDQREIETRHDVLVYSTPPLQKGVEVTGPLTLLLYVSPPPNFPNPPAMDGQGGAILKSYREHLVSPDNEFLKRNWPRIKLGLAWLLHEDGNDDGILEGEQHQTYDTNYYGANTMVGSIYLGALRAGEEMARIMGEDDYADRLRRVYERGRKNTVDRLWNGEYFIQDVDITEHPLQQGDGCLSDQLLGQSWASQVGLGHLYPETNVRGALEAIWRYNWAPDVSTQGDVHKPMRYLAEPGESGLINCTWPKSKHMGDNAVRYKNEVWTGIEYQVASHMLYEGMVEEGLAIVRSIHDRYDGVKHNPWNEIECGDHYARALASWGCLLGISGFSYDGPAGRIGFSPKLTPEDFRAFFSGAEGWGSYAQARGKDFQTGTIDVNWGALALRTIDLELPQNQPDARLSVSVSGRPVGAKLRLAGASATVVLNDEAVLKADESLDIKLEW